MSATSVRRDKAALSGGAKSSGDRSSRNQAEQPVFGLGA